MSSTLMYDMSVGVMIQALDNLQSYLKKGEKWVEENNKVSKEGLIDGKIAEDMKTLPFQIQTCCNSAKFVPVRVGGVEDTCKLEDNETTFPQLYERIEKTIAFLKSVKPESMNGKETKEVTMVAGGKELKFTGLNYIQNFALPNFFFHQVCAYMILRKAGVDVGKFDYLDAKGELRAQMAK